MKHISSLYGSLKEVYSGMYAEYNISRSRKKLLLSMAYELHNLGFFIMKDGTTLYREYFINSDNFKGKLKMLALKTDSNRYLVKDNGVYLIRDYKYFNIECILKYVGIPLVVAVALITYIV
jgi:hypothetical protein